MESLLVNDVYVGTLEAQLEIFKVLVKDDELNCFDDTLVYIKKLPEPEKSMINEIVTICKFLLVNPATSEADERSFSAVRRLKTWLRSTMTQDRFSNLTVLNNHKQRTNKLCLLDMANEFVGRKENRKKNFGIFSETYFNF